MGTEFVVDGAEPVFEVDDDMQWAIDQVGGWTYLRDGAGASTDYTGVVVPADRLIAMADLCDVLAEQYGDEARTFIYERPAAFSDHSLGQHPFPGRPLALPGSDLARCLVIFPKLCGE